MIANLMLIPNVISDCPEKQFLGKVEENKTLLIMLNVGVGVNCTFWGPKLKIEWTKVFLVSFIMNKHNRKNFLDSSHFPWFPALKISRGKKILEISHFISKSAFLQFFGPETVENGKNPKISSDYVYSCRMAPEKRVFTCFWG